MRRGVEEKVVVCRNEKNFEAAIFFWVKKLNTCSPGLKARIRTWKILQSMVEA